MAVQQLETALRLYFEGSDFYSVITLAGAAELLLAQALRYKGKVPRLDGITSLAAALYTASDNDKPSTQLFAERANMARNALKHWNWKEGQPLVIAFDAREEADDMLDRAVSNYWALVQELTPSMERFLSQKLKASRLE